MHRDIAKRLFQQGNVGKIVALAEAKAASESNRARRRFLRLTRQAVHQWQRNGVPPERCALVEAATGIPKHELRPDIFDAPQKNGKGH